MTLWAIKAPSGALMPETISATPGGAYMNLFDLQDEAFRSKYWKRERASREAYKRRGYRAIKARLVAA